MSTDCVAGGAALSRVSQCRCWGLDEDDIAALCHASRLVAVDPVRFDVHAVYQDLPSQVLSSSFDVCVSTCTKALAPIVWRWSSLAGTPNSTVKGACDWSAECGMRLAKYVAVKNVSPQRDFGDPASFSRQRAMLAIIRPSHSDTPFC